MSIKVKITIVNSLPHPQVYKEYKRLATSFIWNGKKPKVSSNTLVLLIDQGWLNLMDLEVRVKVAMLQWIRRLRRTLQINAADSISFILGNKYLRRLISYKSLPAQRDWKTLFTGHVGRMRGS